MISFSTVELDGHTYDAELLAAPLRAVQARAAGAHHHARRLTLIERALALRTQGLHGSIGGGTGLCSCGLVVSGGEPVEDVEGHLDLDSWLPAYTFVVVKDTQDEAAYVAVCRCGWRESHTAPSPACQAARDHASQVAAVLSSAAR